MTIRKRFVEFLGIDDFGAGCFGLLITFILVGMSLTLYAVAT